MSLIPDCTCRKDFGYVFGDYSLTCPRHASVAKWLKEKQERRAAEFRSLRKQALTRPVHGGYPTVARGVDSTPGTEPKGGA